jgi:hypothetical protein
MYRYGSKGRKGGKRGRQYPTYTKKAYGTAYAPNAKPRQGLSYYGNKGARPITGQELKSVDWGYGRLSVGADNISNGGMTLGGQIYGLVNIACGNDIGQRIGRKVTWKSISIKGIVCRPVINRRIGYRLMVIHDSQPNGTIATVANILMGPWGSTDGDSCQSRVFAHTNLTFRNRFKVLYEKYGAFGASFANTLTDPVNDDVKTDGGTQNDMVTISKYIKCNVETIYGGTGSTNADVSTGQILFVLVSDGDPGGVDEPSEEPFFAGSVRLRFTDS